MGPPPARDMGQLEPEQPDRAAVRAQFPSDQVEQGGFAGAVGADDQAALARLDREAHRGGDAQTAKRLFEIVEDQGTHTPLCWRAPRPGAPSRG